MLKKHFDFDFCLSFAGEQRRDVKRFTAELRVSLMIKKAKVKVWDPLIRIRALAKKIKTLAGIALACIALLGYGLSDNLPRMNHLSLDINVSEYLYFDAEKFDAEKNVTSGGRVIVRDRSFSLRIGSNSGSGEDPAALTRRGDMGEAGTDE